ncbi:hypothetical protein LXL04_033241 [Taraxacum kok-saghyz]
MGWLQVQGYEFERDEYGARTLPSLDLGLGMLDKMKNNKNLRDIFERKMKVAITGPTEWGFASALISQSNLADSDSLAIKLSPDSNGNPFPKAELIDNSQFESSVYTDTINRVAKLTRKPVISDSLEPLKPAIGSFFFLCATEPREIRKRNGNSKEERTREIEDLISREIERNRDVETSRYSETRRDRETEEGSSSATVVDPVEKTGAAGGNGTDGGRRLKKQQNMDNSIVMRLKMMNSDVDFFCFGQPGHEFECKDGNWYIIVVGMELWIPPVELSLKPYQEAIKERVEITQVRSNATSTRLSYACYDGQPQGEPRLLYDVLFMVSPKGNLSKLSMGSPKGNLDKDMIWVFMVKVERHRSTAGVEHEVIFYEILIRGYPFMSKGTYEMVFATRECVTSRMLKEDYDNLEGIVDSYEKWDSTVIDDTGRGLDELIDAVKPAIGSFFFLCATEPREIRKRNGNSKEERTREIEDLISREMERNRDAETSRYSETRRDRETEEGRGGQQLCCCRRSGGENRRCRREWHRWWPEVAVMRLKKQQNMDNSIVMRLKMMNSDVDFFCFGQPGHEFECKDGNWYIIVVGMELWIPPVELII